MTGIRIRRREPFNLITTATGGNSTRRRRRRGAQQKPSHQSVGTNGNYRELLKSCFMGFRRVISFQIGSSLRRSIIIAPEDVGERRVGTDRVEASSTKGTGMVIAHGNESAFI